MVYFTDLHLIKIRCNNFYKFEIDSVVFVIFFIYEKYINERKCSKLLKLLNFTFISIILLKIRYNFAIAVLKPHRVVYIT